MKTLHHDHPFNQAIRLLRLIASDISIGAYRIPFRRITAWRNGWRPA